jgi:hypothetical protein
MHSHCRDERLDQGNEVLSFQDWRNTTKSSNISNTINTTPKVALSNQAMEVM